MLRHWFNLLRPALALVSLAAVFALTACEERKPTKMELRPEGPISMESTTKVVKLSLAFYDAKGSPFVRKPDAVFDAADPSVVTVTALPNGAEATLRAKKSGFTTVNVKAFGLTGSVDVNVSILGKIVFDPVPKSKLKIGGKPFKVKAKALDDRGKEMKGLKIAFSTSDHCVVADPDGTITPVAEGECDVIAERAGVSASHTFNVR